MADQIMQPWFFVMMIVEYHWKKKKKKKKEQFVQSYWLSHIAHYMERKKSFNRNQVSWEVAIMKSGKIDGKN